MNDEETPPGLVDTMGAEVRVTGRSTDGSQIEFRCWPPIEQKMLREWMELAEDMPLTAWSYSEEAGQGSYRTQGGPSSLGDDGRVWIDLDSDAVARRPHRQAEWEIVAVKTYPAPEAPVVAVPISAQAQAAVATVTVVRVINYGNKTSGVRFRCAPPLPENFVHALVCAEEGHEPERWHMDSTQKSGWYRTLKGFTRLAGAALVVDFHAGTLTTYMLHHPEGKERVLKTALLRMGQGGGTLQ